MYLKYSFIIFLFFVAVLASCSAQKNGYVVTNTNDTIRGKFKLLTSYTVHDDDTNRMFSVYSTKHVKNDIQVNDIKNINIVKGKKVADTYIISNNKFWQFMVRKGSLAIYRTNYNEISEGEGISYNYAANIYEYGKVSSNSKYVSIAIFSGKIQEAQIYTGLKNTNYPDIDKEVLQFINSRYKLNLTFKDLNINMRPNFVHQQKLFNFVLNKEPELENDTTTKVN